MWGNIYIFIRFYEKSPVSKETELLKRILLKDSQSPNDSYLDSTQGKAITLCRIFFPAILSAIQPATTTIINSISVKP